MDFESGDQPPLCTCQLPSVARRKPYRAFRGAPRIAQAQRSILSGRDPFRGAVTRPGSATIPRAQAVSAEAPPPTLPEETDAGKRALAGPVRLHSDRTPQRIPRSGLRLGLTEAVARPPRSRSASPTLPHLPRGRRVPARPPRADRRPGRGPARAASAPREAPGDRGSASPASMFLDRTRSRTVGFALTRRGHLDVGTLHEGRSHGARLGPLFDERKPYNSMHAFKARFATVWANQPSSQ
jgi:hypothetical protein